MKHNQNVLKCGPLLAVLLIPVLLFDGCGQKKAREKSGQKASQSKPEKELSANHPRLLIESTSVLEDWRRVEPGSDKARFREYILEQADAICASNFLQRDLDRRSVMLDVSRETLRRVLTLSIAFHVTEKEVYLERAKNEMFQAAAFKDWNPEHFLDVAEMSTALALGYDWLYADLKPKERFKIIEALLNKGIKPYIKAVNQKDTAWWYRNANNWTFVCNGGIMTSALAIGQRYPEVLDMVQDMAVSPMKSLMQKHLPPDGLWYEGPSYWGYSMNYICLTAGAMQTALGTDSGLLSVEGMDRAAQNFLSTQTPSGRYFNFADSKKEKRTPELGLAYLGHYFQDSVALHINKAYLLEEISKGGTGGRFLPLHMLYWPEKQMREAHYGNRTDHYRNESDILVLQGRGKHRDLALLAKGGKGNMDHGQYDMGTFILEKDSVLWIEDMGKEHYHLPGFWEFEKGGQRWTYWRNTNLLHSTLVLNNRPMDYEAEAVVDKGPTVEKPVGKLNLSSCYASMSDSIFRTFSLLDSLFQINDELFGVEKDSLIRWQLVTTKGGEPIGNTLVLKNRNHYLHVKVKKPKVVIWKAFPNQSGNLEEHLNEEYKVWGFEFPAKKDLEEIVVEIK